MGNLYFQYIQMVLVIVVVVIAVLWVVIVVVESGGIVVPVVRRLILGTITVVCQLCIGNVVTTVHNMGYQYSED